MSVQPQPTYEFNDEQNKLIGSLGYKMSAVGLVLIVLGILSLVQAIGYFVYWRQGRAPVPAGMPPWAPVASAVLSAILQLMLGVWTRSAGLSFMRIVESSNRDIWHLMNGLTSLHKVYSFIYALIWAIIIVSLLVMVAALMGWFPAVIKPVA